MMQTALDQLNLKDRPSLAFVASPGRAPTVLFLTGLRSDMEGAKALRLEQHCRQRGQAFVRFDYRGHGASGGLFEEGCVSDWCEDALAVVDVATVGSLVLVGSSMGGWIMLLVARQRPERVAGLVGIAAAPDFTHDLILPKLTPSHLGELDRDGVILAPSAYGEPTPITRRLLEDGERNLVLQASPAIRCPVHLLHGQQDPDVPWQTSLRLAGRLESTAVTVELVKDGDHRLSREEDLRRIEAALDRVLEQAAGRA
jgi:pimeloyl-ACP methyl ester carboxylesterase